MSRGAHPGPRQPRPGTGGRAADAAPVPDPGPDRRCARAGQPAGPAGGRDQGVAHRRARRPRGPGPHRAHRRRRRPPGRDARAHPGGHGRPGRGRRGHRRVARRRAGDGGAAGPGRRRPRRPRRRPRRLPPRPRHAPTGAGGRRPRGAPGVSIEPAPIGGWVRRLWPFLAAHRGDALLAFGISVIGVGFVQGATPWVERRIVDDVIVAHRSPLAPWLAVLVVFGVVNFIAGYVRRYYGGRVSLDVQYDLRTAIFERLQRLDFARHDEMETGQLVSRSSSDVGLIQGMLAFLPVMSGNLVQLVVAFGFMLWYSPLLTLVSLGAVPLLFVVALRMRTSIFPATWHNQQLAAEVAGVVDENVTGVRVVKAFGQEDREVGRLTGSARRLFASRFRTVRLQARYTPTLAAIPTLVQVAILALGGWMALHHRLSLGTFLLFSTYAIQLVAPVRMFASVLAVGQQARAGAERILDILDSNPLVTEAPDARPLGPVAGAIEFDDVRFGYRRDEPVLNGF